MKFASALLLLFLWVAVARPTLAQGELTLPPHLGDNMVVQNRDSTLFYGAVAPHERVRVQIKGRRISFGRTKADERGFWSRDLSFGAPSVEPLEIEIYLGNPERLARTLTNIVVGEVWLAGIASGQGISAPPQRPSTNLRFIEVKGFAPGNGGKGWLVADTEGLARGAFDLLAFEHALHQASKGIVVGVVHLPDTELAAALRDAAGSYPADFETRLVEVKKATEAAIIARSAKLRKNKRAGIVENVPIINQYKKHLLFAPSHFRPRNDLTSRLKFEGAIAPEER